MCLISYNFIRKFVFQCYIIKGVLYPKQDLMVSFENLVYNVLSEFSYSLLKLFYNNNNNIDKRSIFNIYKNTSSVNL